MENGDDVLGHNYANLRRNECMMDADGLSMFGNIP
jgi:hypothetical protein